MVSKPHEILERVHKSICQIVVGKPDEVRMAMTGLAASGHILFEDVPGVGKTTLAESLARAFGLSYSRIQFTADLLPADILGSQVFVQQKNAFEFRPGPIFNQVVLADELNRAPPRTQSALLEAMAQTQISLDGTTHALPRPFAVIATQNPLDLAGTYALPDSQLDRFLFRLSLGHLPKSVEAQLVQNHATAQAQHAERTSNPTELSELQNSVSDVRVDPSIAQYVVELAHVTRTHPEIERGVSTRATLSLVAAARANALWEGRNFITPQDVKSVIASAWSHRLSLRNENTGVSARDAAIHLIDDLVKSVPSPR